MNVGCDEAGMVAQPCCPQPILLLPYPVSTAAMWCLYYPFLHAPGQSAWRHAGIMSWVAVTSAMLVFLLVNVLSGGNPPRGYEGGNESSGNKQS